MVERTKRRTEELSTAMDGSDSDAMEPDMATSGSEDDHDEDDADMLNDQMEIDSHPTSHNQQQQRSPSARSRLDSTSSGGQRKKAATSIKLQRQRTSERRTSVRECVECDSASVDSLKLTEELSSPEQIMDLIEEALKNDRRSLERLTREPISHFPILEEETAGQLVELLLRNPQLPVYGQVRWLRQLLSTTSGRTESALLKKSENRKLVEPMLDRASSISENCLRLRGKLDLLMGPTGAVS